MYRLKELERRRKASHADDSGHSWLYNGMKCLAWGIITFKTGVMETGIESSMEICKHILSRGKAVGQECGSGEDRGGEDRVGEAQERDGEERVEARVEVWE